MNVFFVCSNEPDKFQVLLKKMKLHTSKHGQIFVLFYNPYCTDFF